MWFQCKKASVYQKSPVSVFWETSEKMLAGPYNTHQFRHGDHQGIRKPLSKLVERNNAFPTRCRGHGRAWPSVAKGNTIKLRARLGPDRRESFHEDIPQCRDWDDGRYSEFLRSGVLQKVIYGVELDLRTLGRSYTLNSPSIFPGRESTPKRSWLSRASPSFIRSDERPSSPAKGLVSET